MDSSNLASTITSVINEIISNLFSSIDNNIYSYMDELVFLNTKNFSNTPIENLLKSSSNGILLIANSLVVGYLLYYCVKLFISYYTEKQIQRPYQFIFKLILACIIMNSAYFICEQLINFAEILTSAFNEIGKNFIHKEISFKSLITELNSIIKIESNSFNIFSLSGLIKSFCTTNLTRIMLSYSLRLMLTKVLILISPFAFLSLCTESTNWLFKNWFKSFISLLSLQILIKIILIITLSLKYSNNILSKFIYLGSIYSLSKANYYLKELIGGINSDINLKLPTMNSIIKRR